MNIRVLYNILLVRLGIRKVLPINAIRKITITECGEPLVNVPIKDFVILSKDSLLYGRASVIKKLYDVENYLNRYGCRIGIFEIFRDVKTQLYKRNKEFENIKKQYPEINEAEIQKILNSRVANVIKDEIGGHQTGGAIDCTLCSTSGQLLDMGAHYLEFTKKTKTNSSNLSEIQKKNRNLLCTAMKNAGFINYPNEWWHFSYGDKMWAAYKHKPFAIYGQGILPKQ